MNRLTAAAGAAAGTCHDLHKVILYAAGLERLQKLSGVPKAAHNCRADLACAGDLKAGFLPALHAAHGGKYVRVGIFAGDQIVCTAKRRVHHAARRAKNDGCAGSGAERRVEAAFFQCRGVNH